MQVLDRTCFNKNGLLHNEFKILFHSLYEEDVHHMKVIRALAAKPGGRTRSEIIEVCSLTSGGGTTQLLEELSESGFITPYVPLYLLKKLPGIVSISSPMNIQFFV